ncbi:MAG: glycosyltransferase family 2 protein [Planctomycetota bacterium]|jgi:GT2 family glycosyltransferase
MSPTDQTVETLEDVGVVVIGRNEGARLVRCFESLHGRCGRVVYVDSGSTDRSVDEARRRGVEVVELDMATPFTAARARNEGFERMKEVGEAVRYVQFVDGDCEVAPDWLSRCRAELEATPDAAIVCGMLRERHPDASIYNRLFEMEFNQEPGETEWCGGIFMIRGEAFERVGRFNPSIIAGEEPELCLRLRREGMKIIRLPDVMGWHDAAMTRFGQWWKRMKRGGHAYAEGAAMHGRSEDRYCVRDCARIWIYGAVIPLLALAPAWVTNGWSLWLLGVFPLQVWRIARQKQRDGESARHAWLYAVSVMAAKWPQCTGQIKFWLDRRMGRGGKIIEYKAPAAAGDAKEGNRC